MLRIRQVKYTLSSALVDLEKQIKVFAVIFDAMFKDQMSSVFRILAACLLAVFLHLACPFDSLSNDIISIEISEKSAEKEVEKELDEDMFSSELNKTNKSPKHLNQWCHLEDLLSLEHCKKIQTPPPERKA